MTTTLIICALPEELKAVEKQFAGPSELIQLSQKLNVYCSRFETPQGLFYTLLSGMGPINASSRLSLALHELPIERVLLLGVAGGLSTQTKIGDLVTSSSVLQHDYHSSLESGNFPMRSGVLILSKDEGEKHDPLIPADKNLIEKCLSTKIQGHQILSGVVASGSEFVGRAERKQSIGQHSSKPLAVDMEACAVANLCFELKIPFVVAKTISDTLYSDGSIESDFSKFLEYASQNAAQVVRQFIN